MKVLLAHPGTQHAHQLALQLEKQKLLHVFWTGFIVSERSFVNQFFRLIPNLHKRLGKRIIDLPEDKIKTQVGLEFRTLLRLKRAVDIEMVLNERNRKFQEAIPDSSILACDVVIGFDTSSWILAERCKRLNKRFILDVSIAHPLSKEKVYKQISAAYPEWSFTVKQKSNELLRLEQNEMELADQIVVASSFARDTLVENNVAKLKINVNPYGVDADAFYPELKGYSDNATVHFVFVGLVDARKGIPFLLEVGKEFISRNVTFTLIGPISSEIREFVKQKYPYVIIKGKIPFNELMRQLPKYHVMIFPSYFEGFGLVIPEAMACGLPVITTSATGGPDIIENYKDGIIIEPGNRVELHAAIEYLINSTQNYVDMAERARAKALRYSWKSYGERWKQILSKLDDN